MVDGRVPSVYDVDFADVYDIAFDDVPTNGQALTAETPQAPASDNTMAFDAEPINRTVEVPDGVRDLARSAITNALRGDFRGVGSCFSPMSANRMIEIMKTDNEFFDERKSVVKEAMRDDERLVEVGGRFYPASPDIDPDVYWPYDKTSVDLAKTELVAATIASKLKTGPIGKSHSVRQLLELVKTDSEARHGGRASWSLDEVNEILVSLVQDHGITAREDGNFSLRPEHPGVQGPRQLTKKERWAVNKEERKYRFSQSEVRQIDLITHGRFKTVGKSHKLRKRMYAQLTRSPRTVHPDKLLFK